MSAPKEPSAQPGPDRGRGPVGAGHRAGERSRGGRLREAAFLIGGTALALFLFTAPGSDAPVPPRGGAGLSDLSFDTTGPCTFQPERGGMVAGFVVTSSDTGPFTVRLEAVTPDGVGDLDVTTPHRATTTVQFAGGSPVKRFEVVVPLTEDEHADGFTTCRFEINPQD